MKLKIICQKNRWIIIFLLLLFFPCFIYGQEEPTEIDDIELDTTIDLDSIELATDLDVDGDAINLDIDIDTDLDTTIDLDIDLDTNTTTDAAPSGADDFAEILRLLEALNIETEVVTRNLVPEEELVGEEEFIERTETEEPVEEAQIVREEVTPTESILVAEPEPEPIVPKPEEPPSTAEVVAETLDNIIVATIEKEMRQKRIPKEQPWLEVGMDYYLFNFATSKRFDPFAAVHGVGGISINVKGVEFFYGMNTISQDYVENSIYYTFESINMNYSSMGLSYQYYLDANFSVHVGFIQGKATGAYMGENLKEASQTAIFIGGNYDIFDSVTVRILFVPYLKSVFELDDLEGSYITYDFINDTKITTTETMNNVYIGMTWALPYLRL